VLLRQNVNGQLTARNAFERFLVGPEVAVTSYALKLIAYQQGSVLRLLL
jgi:hypothetical protein